MNGQNGFFFGRSPVREHGASSLFCENAGKALRLPINSDLSS
jgi:hypothetical protein